MANGVPSNISGSAPLYLGSFTSQRGAMAQKMTDRAIQLAEKERTRQSQERAAMLKALSFDAVQGLGRKVQEEHLSELNSLQDKYAKRWIENGRKLTDQDYLDLQRDKTDMQQKIATMKSNVANYAKVSDEIRQGKVAYHPSTVEAMKDYYESGNVGEDFSQYVKVMPDTYGFLNKYTPQLNKLKPRLVERIEGDKKITEGQLSPDAVMAALQPQLENDPTYQALINSDPYTRQAAQKSVENYVQQFTQPTYREDVATKSELYSQQMKEMPEKYQKAAKKYDWGGMSEGEIANAMYFNDFAKRGLMGDPAILNDIKQKAGYLKVEYNPDESITIVRKGYGDKPGEIETIPPTNWDDKDNVRLNMTRLLDYAPSSMGGKQRPDDLQKVLRPDYEVDMKEKPKATVFLEIEKKAEDGTLTASSAKKMIERLFPKERKDETVEAKDKGKIFGFTYQKEGIKWGGKKYAFDSESDMKALVEKLRDKLGYTKEESKSSEPIKYTIGEDVYMIPPEDEAAFLEDNPTAKKG
ncbi:MAG: hypothetical protein JXR54_09985 [Tannerellaceae bacterium]|nr:hypothetical protein [Tannerellaceae bacterium]